MQKATPGSFSADVQYKNKAEQFPHPPASSFTSSLIAATPAKRITFYKSGDPQFKGVKMAIHKRTFKCFDMLLDDLSQKVPLPFGVRNITTPRGTHSIKHLEQLEDGGCYLCSDRRYVKPINMEAAGRRQTVWHHHGHPHNARRKPSRPEDAPSGHLHRHPKRIVLVKNNDPAVRRSILLSRRTARSLRVFMDEISELMQCHVKKLYTMEGRKIDSIQSLMQCSGVLVCVGREPFRPLLMENLMKISDERLPGMTSRSRSSVCSEGYESKKNVNFGLETKKSIIHPRSDSSNISTRFSLSSEKSYQNGLCITPGQSACVSTCPYVKELTVNDDIEKRVLVNKDGSLSVEMKVSFRLFNDETLQWSTEIKKSSAKLTDSSSVKEIAQGYLQDSISPSETEEAFATKMHQKHLEESLRQNCCNHCQEYAVWKNPMHKDLDACKSTSSSGSSQKIVHKKTSLDSTHTISRSSEEYTEHVVEKSSCFQQTVEDGDTKVECCERSRCCSRSEVSTVAFRSKRTSEGGCERNANNKCSYRNISETDAEVTEERAISTISNSSKVLQTLKDDQDDDYDDLPLSVSRAQSDHLEGDAQFKCIHCDCRTSPRSHLSPRPPSKVSSCTVHSVRSKKYKTISMTPVKPDWNHKERTTSAVSNVSSRSHTCDCEAKTSFASGRQRRAKTGCKSSVSTHSRASRKSQASKPGSTPSDVQVQENGSLSAMSAAVSRRSGKTSVCSGCGEHEGLREEPQTAEKDVCSTTTNAQENCEIINKYKSLGKRCTENNKVETSEERTKSGMSAKSAKSDREPTLMSSLSKKALGFKEKRQEASVSPTCGNLDISASSNTSRKSKSACSERALTPRSHRSDDFKEVPSELGHSQDDKSTLSVNHNEQDAGLADVTFNKSNARASECGTLLETKATEDSSCEPDTKVTADERSCDSVSSCKSNASSEYSHTKTKDNRSTIKGNERVPTATSAKSNTSSASHRSHKSSHNLSEITETNRRKSTNTEVKQSNGRTPSEMSGSSKVSSQSQRPGQCHCHSSSSVSKSKTQRQNVEDKHERVNANELLSPTSTASVSLGLAEEHRCDDFEKQSTSDVSITTEDVNDVMAVSVTLTVSEKSRKSCKSPVQTLSPVSAERVQSAKPKTGTSGNHLSSNNIRASSPLSASSSCNKSNAATKKHNQVCVDDTGQAETSEADNEFNEISEMSFKHHQSGKTTPASDCFNSEISVKNQSTRKTHNKSRCSSQYVESNRFQIRCDEVLDSSPKTSISDNRSEKEDQFKPKSDVSQHCKSLPQKKSKKTKASVINTDLSDSVLSRALSAADLLRELVPNARPVSRKSMSITSSENVENVRKIKDNKTDKSSRDKQRKVSNTSEHNNKELYSFMPSYLPNASPAEVVNDWLMNNPIDGPAYEVDVEFTENITQRQEEPVRDKSEAQDNIIKDEEPPENNVSCDDEKPQVESSELDSSSHIVTKKDCLDKQHHSSVQVMKVLLGPKLDRCSSLPEISPAYGRKLSRSAQGLLDCLANLQLIESDSKNEKHPKYNEVMTILQSLWLQELCEDEANKQTGQSAADEFNLQSSSGVDVSSGSTASVQGNMTATVEKSDTAQGKISPIPELENLKQDEALIQDDKTSTAAPQWEDAFNVLSDPTTPNIAERVQGSIGQSQDRAEDEVQSTENKDESDQTQQTSSKKSSESSVMKPAENTSSGTPPSVQRAPLTKRVSQDPDPVWVLSLLKKLEKQFMLHYTDAMAEFKVKWDLDDSEMLKAMISELKEEVHKRIQSSINRELQKIQSRAGRGPRPPGNALSRESTAQTQQRRRRLRVMRNKSITLSRSEENYMVSATENSDQRSDEEYCPCDACLKRKMVSRGVQRAEALSLAPVMMEFDLRKILQMKKDSDKPAEQKIKDQRDANKTDDKDECDENDGEEQGGERDEDAGEEEMDAVDVKTDFEVEEELVGEEKQCEIIQEDAEKAREGDIEEDDEKNDEDIAEDGDVENDMDAKEEAKEIERNMEAGEVKAPEDEQTENGEEQPTTNETTGESDSNKDDLEMFDEKKKTAIENNSQTESEKDEEEDQPTTSRAELKDSETCEHNSTLTEKDKSADSSAVHSEMTRTSVESQPGSVESCTNQTKLHQLQSFMGSIESQGDSVVVITKQPSYKESDELHNHETQKDNVFTEWQISPTIRKRSCKQKKLKDSVILMNGE